MRQAGLTAGGKRDKADIHLYAENPNPATWIESGFPVQLQLTVPRQVSVAF